MPSAPPPWSDILDKERSAGARTEIAAAQSTVKNWFAAATAEARYHRFRSHLVALETVLTGMLEAVSESLSADLVAAEGACSGELYNRCRQAEMQARLVLRLHRWYAQKYEQRRQVGTDRALLSADEIVRSCWTQAFSAVGKSPPTGPLSYLESRYDAYATPRVSVPPDLRAPDDEILRDFVRELPIPVIALPEIATREPWWLILAVHETGHHVQRDLAPDLEGSTRAALLAATEPTGDAELVAAWQWWSGEVFADAFAALNVGPAAARAVQNLAHGTTRQLVARPVPGSRYPPPVVRSALMGEIALMSGAANPGPGVAAAREWLGDLTADVVPAADREFVDRHLDVTRQVAAAIVGVTVGSATMREVCGWTPSRFAANGDVEHWSLVLSGRRVATGPQRREAARLAAAAGVGVRFHPAEQSVLPEELADRYLALLPACGPPGVLAAAPPADVDQVADRFARRLLQEPAPSTVTGAV